MQDTNRLTDFDENNISFRFGATWVPRSDLTLYAHYAEGFRSPPAEDVNLFLDYSGRVQVRALPNPDLESEESTNLEIGMRFRGDATSVDWALYHSSFDNFIESRVGIGVDPTSGALLFQSQNIAESTIYGAEVNVRIDPGQWFSALDDWHGAIGAHWARGKDEISNQPINSISPAKSILTLGWQPGETISTELQVTRYNEQRDLDFSNGAFYVPEAATVVDLSLRWSASEWSEIYIGLNNLTNRKYERYNDVRSLGPTDPRIEQFSRPGRNIAVTFHLRPR